MSFQRNRESRPSAALNRSSAPAKSPVPRPIRPPLNSAFKEDVRILLKSSPGGIYYKDFDNRTRRLLKQYNLHSHRTDDVLDEITDFSYCAGDKVHLLSSYANGTCKNQDRVTSGVIDLTEEEVIVISSDEDGEINNNNNVQKANNNQPKRGIPSSVLEKLRKVLKKRTQIYTDNLKNAFAKKFHEELKPEEYGFDGMDSFLEYLDYTCEDIVFRRITDRTVMIQKIPSTESKDSSHEPSSPANFNVQLQQETIESERSSRGFPPLGVAELDALYPREACNPDITLDTDPVITYLMNGATFEACFGEMYSPDNFYLTHACRMQLLQDMMKDMNQFYREHEVKYKLKIVQVAQRDLLCACAYSKTGEWHRVRILTTDLKTAQIFYVDYGTVETVDVQQLRYLHKDFAEYPPLCVKAKLSGIKPKNGDKYDDSANQAFFKLCGEGKFDVSMFDVKIIKFSLKNNVMEVFIHKQATKSQKSFQELLIEEDVVAPRDSSFNSSPALRKLKSILDCRRSPLVEAEPQPVYFHRSPQTPPLPNFDDAGPQLATDEPLLCNHGSPLGVSTQSLFCENVFSTYHCFYDQDGSQVPVSCESDYGDAPSDMYNEIPHPMLPYSPRFAEITEDDDRYAPNGYSYSESPYVSEPVIGLTASNAWVHFDDHREMSLTRDWTDLHAARFSPPRDQETSPRKCERSTSSEQPNRTTSNLKLSTLNHLREYVRKHT